MSELMIKFQVLKDEKYSKINFDQEKLEVVEERRGVVKSQNRPPQHC